MSSASLETDVDLHLQTYLSLIHAYTTLRTQLATATTALNQHLARANFSSDRGAARRYGQDDYDERMRAEKVVGITISGFGPEAGEKEPAEAGSPVFEIHDVATRDADIQLKTESVEETRQGAEVKQGGDVETLPESGAGRRNAALHQFGILVPPSLRLAQNTAEEIVSELIPKLASIDAEMKAVEIEVRRSRKRVRKAREKDEKDDK